MAKKKATQAEAEKMVESGEAHIPPEAIVSIDHEIGKGLTPKKEQSELDQAQKDFALHPKFSKFKSQGSEQHDK